MTYYITFGQAHPWKDYWVRFINVPGVGDAATVNAYRLARGLYGTNYSSLYRRASFEQQNPKKYFPNGEKKCYDASKFKFLF